MAMTAVAEKMQQRAQGNKHERQHPEHVRAMLGDQKESGDREKCQQGDSKG
jgi:hypothetical protein